MRKMVVLIVLSSLVVMALAPTGIADVPKPVLTIAFDDGRISQYAYAYPLMQERGIRGTFYVISDAVRDNSGDAGFMSYTELLTLQNAGNEIGSHGKTHSYFVGKTEEWLRTEFSVSKQVLESNGLTINNFAFPFGGTDELANSVGLEYYRSLRLAYHGFLMSEPYPRVLNAAAGESGDADADVLANLKSMINRLATTDEWGIIFFHNVFPDSWVKSPRSDCITLSDFRAFLDYIVSKGITTRTVIEMLGNAIPMPEPTPTPTPSPTSTTNLLSNPTIELDPNNKPTPWSFYKTSGMNAVGTVTTGYSGNGLKIASTHNPVTTQQSAMWHQTITGIKTRETYSFRCRYTSNIQATLLMIAYQGSAQLKVSSLNLPASSSWTLPKHVTLTVPPGATALRVDARLFNTASGWAIFDDFELTNTESTTQPTPTSTPTPTPSPTPTANLLSNPTIELDSNNKPTPWNYYKTSNMNAAGTITSGYSGFALKIAATYNPVTTQQSAMWYQTTTNFKVAETYSLRCTYTSNTQATLLIMAYKDSALLKVSSLNLPPSSQWTPSNYVSLTVPTGTTNLRVDARLFNIGEGYAVFDNFELIQK